MHFKQFYLGCLAHASYLVGDQGEAAVVDPRRDVQEYLDEAEAQGLAIRYVIETHLHADFVSGHLELAERTGATVVMGARAGALFAHRAVSDGDELRLGRVVLRFLETPGHTPESLCVVVTDTAASAQPRLVLTGDTLFIGDVGRPDLACGPDASPAAMAEMLYDSLHGKLLTLPDAVEVYPAHGAGSLCGRNISKETSSTIGEQRRGNWALQPMGRSEFVRALTADLPEAPAYFSYDAALNRRGAPALADRPRPRALSPEDAEDQVARGAIALDVRGGPAFAAGHLAGSLHVGLDGQFASWAGALLPPDRPLVIVAEDEAAVDQTATRLARVGLDTVAGYLAGGVRAWSDSGRPLLRLAQVTVDELQRRMDAEPGLRVLDVRRPGEYAAGHVPGAISLPLDRLQREWPDAGAPTAVICAGGYRSSAAASLLEAHGVSNLVNVVGGTSAWMASGLPVARD
jgi:glyoxylase-like metal-dependent hydrolase (beta-lactamase superfamily II)/rhodanese-related sulfurtransferase